MADKITYVDKESLVTDPTIAEKNKVTDNNMNEIKSAVNNNADQLDETIVIGDENITNNSRAVINEVETLPYINSEIDNTYGTAENRGYSQEYLNKVTDYSTTEQVIGKWVDGKPLYRSVFNITNITDTNSNLVDLQPYNISIMTKITGFIKDTSAFIMPIPLTDSSSNYNVLFYNGRYLRGRCSIGTSNPVAQAYAIIEYTKTTD